MGELVHNKEVINRIKDKGIIIVDGINEVEDNARLIVRAHGVDKRIFNKAKDKNLEVIDLTCPYVSKIHDIV